MPTIVSAGNDGRQSDNDLSHKRTARRHFWNFDLRHRAMLQSSKRKRAQMAIGDDIHHIHGEWSDALRHRDARRLGALYAKAATLESPAVLLLDDRFDGVIVGREEIVSFFDALFDRFDETVCDLFRSGDLFFDRRLVAWECAGEDPSGAMTRSVEAMEIENGLILHHRVYWNWAGMRALRAALPPPRDLRRDAPLILVRPTCNGT